MKNSVIDKKIILYGAGVRGRELLEKYGSDKVAFFCDQYKYGELIEGIEVISIEQLQNIYNDYRVIITPEGLENILAIQDVLERYGIPFELPCAIPPFILHCWSQENKISFEYNISTTSARERKIMEDRIKRSINLLERTYEQFSNNNSKDIDVWIYFRDNPLDALKLKRILNLKYIFAFSTIFSIQDEVIAIPDYIFGDLSEDDEYYSLTSKIEINAAKQYVDERAVWAGDISNSPNRELLFYLGEKRADKLLILDTRWDRADASLKKPKTFINQTDLYKWKYVIDARGYGWTDRVKILLQTGRPLLLIDRPYKEFFFDKMIPNVHYIPIKEDLSDLIEKIENMDSDKKNYDYIVKNAKEFAQKYLTMDSVIDYYCNCIEKYCMGD